MGNPTSSLDPPASQPSAREDVEDATSEDEDYLSERLFKCLVPSEFEKDSRIFMPEGTLDQVITRKSVLEAMNIENPTTDDEELLKFILEKAKKVFATSVSIKLDQRDSLKRAMLKFKEYGIDDSKLPIEDKDDGSPNILASLESGVKLRQKIWSLSTIHEFCDDQWRFLVPVFSMDARTDINRYNLSFSTIIPFVKKYDDDPDPGSFGQVYKYEIHPNHIKGPLRPGEPCPKVVAVKQIRPGNSEDRQQVTTHWESEIKALERMNDLNQDHIVRFITAFRICHKDDKHHYLMFEWADGGNLKTLWETIPQPLLNASLVRAAIQQLLGLAEALATAHYLPNNSSYRHGDLKPANILRFDDGSLIGRLKIGDWGEAKEHNNVTEFRFSQTTAAYTTHRYQAPEVETGVNPRFLHQSKKRRSRLYDIWAMGCITLEFMIWLLYGLKGLDSFNQEFPDKSPFYQISDEEGERTANVHEAVLWWMDHIATEQICQQFKAMGLLLELVRDGLLVVKLPRRTGSNLSMSSEPVRVANSFGQTASESVENISNSPTPPIVTESSEAPMSNVPTINITPAVQTMIPVEPTPEAPGKVRVLATEFKQRLDNISGEEDVDDSYWFTDEPRSIPPPYPNRSSYMIPRGEDDTGSNWNSGPTNSDQRVSKSLDAPEVERV